MPTPTRPHQPPSDDERPKTRMPTIAGKKRTKSRTGWTSSIRGFSRCQPWADSNGSMSAVVNGPSRRVAGDGVGHPGELLDDVEGARLVEALDRQGAGRRRRGHPDGRQPEEPGDRALAVVDGLDA